MKVLLYPFYRQENWVSDGWWHLLGPTTRWPTPGSRAAAPCTHLPLFPLSHPFTASPQPWPKHSVVTIMVISACSFSDWAALSHFCLFRALISFSVLENSKDAGVVFIFLPQFVFWNEVFFFFFHGVQQGQHTVTNIQSFLLTSSVSLSLPLSLKLLLDSVYALQ